MENNIKNLSGYLDFISDTAKQNNLDIELIRYNFRMNNESSYHFFVLKNKNPDIKENIKNFMDEINDKRIILKYEIKNDLIFIQIKA